MLNSYLSGSALLACMYNIYLVTLSPYNDRNGVEIRKIVRYPPPAPPPPREASSAIPKWDFNGFVFKEFIATRRYYKIR